MTDLVYTPIDAPEPRKCRRHQWVYQLADHGGICCRCGNVRNAVASRRGRNNRSRGNRAELAVARKYGGEKTGPLGQPEDIHGKAFRTQVKTHQGNPPARWKAIFGALDTQHDGRTPVLLLRYLPGRGIAPEDFFVVRGVDWLALHGRDE